MNNFLGVFILGVVLYLFYRFLETEKQLKEMERNILFLYEGKFNKPVVVPEPENKPAPVASEKKGDGKE